MQLFLGTVIPLKAIFDYVPINKSPSNNDG